METSLALGRTDAQYRRSLKNSVRSAQDDYLNAFVEAGHIHTDAVREAQIRWNSLNRISVEIEWARSGQTHLVFVADTGKFTRVDRFQNLVRL
jgi:hypothetical protein